MKKICDEKYSLTPENIDRVSEKVGELLKITTGLVNKEILRIRLSMEEILLNWMQLGQNHEVSLLIEQYGNKMDLTLELSGEFRENPLKNEENFGSSEKTEIIMANLGLAWMYQYVDNKNRVSIRIPRKNISQIKMMGIAIGLAIISAFLLGILPQGVSKACSEYVIEPVFDTFMDLLSAIVSPMMFLSVIWGVFSIGNSKQLGLIGKKISLRFVAQNTVAAVLGAILLVSFFPIQFTASGGGDGQIKALLDMLYNIVPSNIVSPFIEGNTLQIIFLALVVGTTMTILQNQVTIIARIIEQLDAIIQQILSVISRLVPIFIYLSILRLAISDQLSGMGSFVKMILVYLLGLVVLLCYYLFSVKRSLKVSIRSVLKKLTPPFLIALTTASSAATFSECAETCINRFGISKKFVNFSLPLGMVIFMPTFALWIVLFGGACAEYSAMTITLVDIITLIVIAVFLAIACPPVPGGALTCYTLLLLQLNIPLEVIAIASAIDVIADFTGTAGDLFGNQTQQLIVANKLHMVDRKKLMS